MTPQTIGTVLVTGASAGFGEAIARRFAGGGARVIAVARRRERLDALAAEFGDDQVLPLALDVGDRDAVASALAELPGRFADVDCLVNNAGLALGLEPAQRAELADWDRMIDTNCRGLVAVTRALLPRMVERARGHIVNLGSVAGTYPYPGGNVYGATKAFVHLFSLNSQRSARDRGAGNLHRTGDVRRHGILHGALRGRQGKRRRRIFRYGAARPGRRGGHRRLGHVAAAARERERRRDDARRAELRPVPGASRMMVPRVRPKGVDPRVPRHAGVGVHGRLGAAALGMVPFGEADG